MTDDEAALFASLPGAVVAVDDEDKVLFASPMAQLLLGWDEQLVGHPLTVIIPARLQKRHLEGFQKYVQSGVSRLEGRPVRVPALCRDGTEKQVDLAIRVFRRPDGSKLAVATIAEAGYGRPRDLVIIANTFAQRTYELV